jgi:hypothetical protein
LKCWKTSYIQSMLVHHFVSGLTTRSDTGSYKRLDLLPSIVLTDYVCNRYIYIYIYIVDNQVILTKLTLGSSKKNWKSDLLTTSYKSMRWIWCLWVDSNGDSTTLCRTWEKYTNYAQPMPFTSVKIPKESPKLEP